MNICVVISHQPTIMHGVRPPLTWAWPCTVSCKTSNRTRECQWLTFYFDCDANLSINSMWLIATCISRWDLSPSHSHGKHFLGIDIRLPCMFTFASSKCFLTEVLVSTRLTTIAHFVDTAKQSNLDEGERCEVCKKSFSRKCQFLASTVIWNNTSTSRYSHAFSDFELVREWWWNAGVFPSLTIKIGRYFARWMVHGLNKRACHWCHVLLQSDG